MSKILQTPVVNAITPFDPTNSHKITFTYTDNQAVKNRAVITDNATGAQVYDAEQIGMGVEHTIPANTLTAGKQYLAQIQVFDIDGNSSNLSNSTLFYCFSNPRFTFSGLEDGETYRNASITLNLDYVQTEGEPIKSFQFMKYSYDKTLLESSDMFYSASPTSYSFYSLENKTTYYFRAIGETSHGIPLDTGYIEVNISYEQLPIDIVFDVENDYCNGYISLGLNIKVIGYEIENDNYTIKDGMLTLTNNSLTYNDGFSIENDFSLYVDVKRVKTGTFLVVNDNIFSLSVINVCGTYYCKLVVDNSDIELYAELPNAQLDVNNESDAEIIDVSYGATNTVVFEVKRKNGYYSLNAYERTV